MYDTCPNSLICLFIQAYHQWWIACSMVQPPTFTGPWLHAIPYIRHPVLRWSKWSVLWQVTLLRAANPNSRATHHMWYITKADLVELQNLFKMSRNCRFLLFCHHNSQVSLRWYRASMQSEISAMCLRHFPLHLTLHMLKQKQKINIPILPEASLTFASKSFMAPPMHPMNLMQHVRNPCFDPWGYHSYMSPNLHSEKKGTETVPLGYYCYK